jgi:hypothetical protein
MSMNVLAVELDIPTYDRFMKRTHRIAVMQLCGRSIQRLDLASKVQDGGTNDRSTRYGL